MNDISSNIVVGSKIVDEVEDFPRLVTRVTEGRGKADSRTNDKQRLVEQQIVPHQKEQFIQNIKKWVLLDSQLKTVNEKTKRMREMKHELTKQISEYSNNHKINNKIVITDGELRITEKKEYSPLTFTYVQECLQNIISEQEQVDFIMNYLKENREISLSPDIRRTFSN